MLYGVEGHEYVIWGLELVVFVGGLKNIVGVVESPPPLFNEIDLRPNKKVFCFSSPARVGLEGSENI